MWDKWVCNKTFTISDLHRDLGYSLKNNKPISKNSTHIRGLLTLLRGASLVDYMIVEGRNSHGVPIDLYKISWSDLNYLKCLKSLIND